MISNFVSFCFVCCFCAGIDKQEIIFEQMVEQIVCEGNKISMPDSTLQDEDSVSTEPALMSSSQSRDNNTYSSISSSDFGEQVAAVQSRQPCREDSGSDDRALTEEDFERMMSSYENVYDGVQLTPEVSKLAMNASDLDIGDRFDTKQLDLHLQPTGRSSSYEQLYKETGKEIAETSEQAEQVVYSAESKEGELNNVGAATDSLMSDACSKPQSEPTCLPAKRSVRFETDPSQIHITVESGLDTLGCDDSMTTESTDPEVLMRAYSWDPEWDPCKSRSRTYSAPGTKSRRSLPFIFQEKGIVLLMCFLKSKPFSSCPCLFLVPTIFSSP